MSEMFTYGNTEGFGTIVWNVVITATFLNDGLNLPKMPMVD